MKLVEFIESVEYEKTDKYYLGLIHEVYEIIFTESLRDSTLNLLEIGIKDGLSLLLWKDYFLNATITGIDIKECLSLNKEERIIQLIEDAYTINTVKTLPSNFDIIIDDGPHTLESMIFFLTHYPNLCRKGGLVILEDILYADWMPTLLSIAKTHGTVKHKNIKNLMRSDRLQRKWKDRDYFTIVLEV
jgi:hypothetical protein